MLKESKKIIVAPVKKSPDTPDTLAERESRRKDDHIALAIKSQVFNSDVDDRFYYEPLLAAHPQKELQPVIFLQKKMKAPLWISSMTGGTELANAINNRLARACAEFGLGMGLGSCRMLLESDDYLEDFNLRKIIGDSQPFFANLGIAQVERLLKNNEGDKITALVEKLKADGLIVHVNPLQEWLQPEGDEISQPPIDTIRSLLEQFNYKVIVKEVGQGMGPESLKSLMQLPLAAIEFAAHGGTNFSKVELLRSDKQKQDLYKDLAHIGHSANDMVEFTNQILNELGDKAKCREVIVSGGIKSFLDGYYLIKKINCNGIYGQGSAMLEHAKVSYENLREYLAGQIKGIELAFAYLKIKNK